MDSRTLGEYEKMSRILISERDMRARVFSGTIRTRKVKEIEDVIGIIGRWKDKLCGVESAEPAEPPVQGNLLD